MHAACALLSAITLCATRAGGEPVNIESVPGYEYVDPNFEAFRLALASRGEEFSAAYIQGITGMAFRIAGPCPCAPTCSMAMEPQALVKLLGYETEHLNLGGSEASFERPVQEVVARVKEEVKAGRPVPVWHAFTSAEWDLVTGFDDEKGEFIGRGSYVAGSDEFMRAKQDRMQEAVDICPAYGALIIGERTGTFDARRAELDALEEAVRHCHAPKDPLLVSAERSGHEAPWRCREGKACYDAWIHTFRANPQYVPGGPMDRYPLGVYASTRTAAPLFLREIAPKYPKAQEHLLEAAEHLGAEAAALGRVRDEVLGWGVEWAEPDPAKAACAAELLTEARKAYGKGMKEVERALTLIDPERVQSAHRAAPAERSDGRAMLRGNRVLAGIHPLKWAQGHDCTFIGALEQALRQVDSFYTYSDLMGLSGLAFRVRWANADTATKWCPSCAVGEMPDEQTLLREQIGWELSGEWLEPEGRDKGTLRRRLAAEIDAGRPVLVYPACWDVGFVYGYEDRGRTLIANSYMSDEMPCLVPVEKLGPWVTSLGEPTEAPPPRKALRRALRAAVRNWRREKHDGGVPDREYWYGEAALKAWIADLGGWDDLDDEARKALSALDPWVYTQLYDARKAAIAFLKDWSCLTDGEALQAMLRAAELYEQECARLDELLPEKRQALESDAPLTTEVCGREAGVLTEALELERAAMGQIEGAAEKE